MLKKRTRWIKSGLILAVLLLASLSASAALAAPNAQGAVTINLCATTGSMAQPNSASIPIWGFSLDDGNCSNPAQLPGPVLDGITAGSSVTVNLTNHLPVA
ncbi:MAG: hypothetical protein ACE5G8_13185, partial [Anaerolineae bacterium]